MHLRLSYRQIWNISAPIMLGSAVQNVIALSDAVLLSHVGKTEFEAIGFVGVFYLVIAAIGYSFSRGGQIMIARRMGERRPEAVGHTFHTMLLFELMLAAVMWSFMRFGSEWFFSLFLDQSPDVYNKCLEYIHFRSYGIFFSYAGVALIALYSGIARPLFILIDAVLLALINLVLNYALIFGKFGLPEMGIGGSGLASSIAEAVAFVLFVGYMIFDKRNRILKVFTRPEPDWHLTRQQLTLSFPVVAQAAVGQGSWLFFLGMVENLKGEALDISNMARMVYLMLSIPLWGFASGVNTLVSNLIGQGRGYDIMRAAWKTSLLCWGVTLVIAIPILCFPSAVLSPLLGPAELANIDSARPTFYLLFVILGFATVGSIYVNTLSGTGATWHGLKIQAAAIVVYLIYIKLNVHYSQDIFHGNIPNAVAGVWTAEIVYWAVMLTMVLAYLRTGNWQAATV